MAESHGNVITELQVDTLKTTPLTNYVFAFEDINSWISLHQAFKLATSDPMTLLDNVK